MYIAMDMGTSNTRLWLCDRTATLGTAKAPIGAGTTKVKGKAYLFEELKKLIATLLAEHKTTFADIPYILVSGMAGSEMGLRDVPHIPLPANFATLAGNLKTHEIPEIAPVPFIFVPGLKKMEGNRLDDVMRGEEVETAGILQAMNLAEEAVLVLPGTHNKVIHVNADGTLTDFYTTFSGELLNLIITNSILKGMVTHDFTLCKASLLEGAAYARDNGFNASLFHIRVMALNGTDANALSSFLYGCVLGQDTERILKTAGKKTIFIGGRENLKEAYCCLLGSQARPLDSSVSANAVRDGLMSVAGLLSL